MKPRTLIFGLLGGVVLAMSGIRSAAWAQKDTAFNEPVSYCKAVGDINAPDATKEATAGRQIFKVDAQDYPSELWKKIALGAGEAGLRRKRVNRARANGRSQSPRGGSSPAARRTR
jgi:hypothetical protein